MKPKIIFFGTSEFGAIIVKGLIKNDYKPFLVVTEPDKPAGRHKELISSPVKITAKKNKIPISQPAKIRNLKLEIINSKPDLSIVAAYGQVLPKEILESPTYGCLNVHPSLLPKYRGPSPIQTAILNGDKETGVTIILMDEKIDHGPILARQELEIPITKITYQKLHDNLAGIGVEMLLGTIPKWLNGTIKPLPQDESKATYTKILTKEDGRIGWQKPAEEIERQILAFNPWPGSFTYFNSKLLKILEAYALEVQTAKQAGEVFLTNDGKLVVGTGQNCLILQKLQLEGKKPMTADDFLRGHRDFIGTILQ